MMRNMKRSVQLNLMRILGDSPGISFLYIWKISWCSKVKAEDKLRRPAGQLMRSLAELPLATIRIRLEPRLSTQSRGILNAQLNMLHRHWRQDLLQNDRRFVEVMGGQDDPNRSSLEQYFNMLLHNDSLTSGLSGEASRMVQAAISRYTRSFMCLRFSEFSLRTLSTNGRRSFLEWITTCRLRDRHARESQLM